MRIKTQSATRKIKTEDLKELQIPQKDYCKLQNTFLWRYMSLPKFLDLILNRRLYFADLVTLAKEDPYGKYFLKYNIIEVSEDTV